MSVSGHSLSLFPVVSCYHFDQNTAIPKDFSIYETFYKLLSSLFIEAIKQHILNKICITHTKGETSMFHKKYIAKYLIVSIVLAVLLFCLEYFGGVAVGIIPMGSGGECSQALTLGGCAVTTIYPMGPGDSTTSQVHREITSHPILLVGTFILRLIIVIPLTNLFWGDKDDFDYTEELGM